MNLKITKKDNLLKNKDLIGLWWPMDNTSLYVK